MRRFQTRLGAGTLLGWLVAVSGVIWLFKEPTANLGAQVATVAVVTLGAVIYGVVLTYLVVNPICDYLLEQAKQNRVKNLMIVEGVGLLLKKKNPFEVLEAVNLALPVPHHVDWRDIFEERVDRAA